MSDDGDKTCPLCAEEMDLTDQQLKPCKCGYDICVWCWHHIVDMAEKDEAEGRCPACRTPYDKEKIVGTAANCERLVAEVSSERKVKPQKTKTKISEGRKQLSSVRVIQRNLVYIVGLPLNLADEDVLQRREYFGQYGKVLKVSMSRTAAGAIQQFPNSTCSVYITYAKEDEAVRCIQLVHGFILDGRSLRACFGTTKYCHAWLRNVACTNPECLYLHEVGSQDDSFTKDEIVSAYTRNRVQQITGTTNNLQWRSGSVLPPPADDYCSSSSASTGKPIAKNASNTTTSVTRGSPPNGSSSSRSVPLPASTAWGTRISNCQPSGASLTCSNGSAKSKSDATTATLASSSAVSSTSQASLLPSGTGKKPTLHKDSHSTLGKVKSEPLKSLKLVVLDHQTATSGKSAAPGVASSLTSNGQLSSVPPSKDSDRSTSQPSNITNSFDHSKKPGTSDAEKGEKVALNGKIQNLCSDISSMSIDKKASEHSGVSSPNSFTDHGLTKLPSQASQQYYTEQYREPLTSPSASKPAPVKSGTYDGVCVSAEHSDLKSNLNTRVSNSSHDVEEDILSFDCQRLKDPEVVNHSMPLPNSTNLVHGANLSRAHSLQQSEADAVNLNVGPLFVDNNGMDRPHLYASNVSSASNGSLGHQESSSGAAAFNSTPGSFLLPNDMKGTDMERLMGDRSNVNGISIDKGESSIISNILSMDFDVWDDSLTSPKNLANLLGGTDKQSDPGKNSSPWKAQNSSQSRFSFARQEEPINQVFDFDPLFSGIGQPNRNRSFSQDCAENGDSFFGKSGMGSGFSYGKFEGLDNFGSSQSAFCSNKLSAVSRGQISAPPGFSAPSRAPPPGFSSQDRMDQAFDPMSGNHLLDTSSLFRNSYQAPSTGNVGSNVDIEFMDPAILAVGKGRPQGGFGFNNACLDARSNFTQLSAFENEARLQLLMQRSVSQQPNLRYPDIGNNYSAHNESYGISSRLMDQSHHMNSLSSYPQLSLQQQQQSRNAGMSNGHWEGNNSGMAELLRNERLGFNKFYTGYEDPKFRMGDQYNRTFGM